MRTQRIPLRLGDQDLTVEFTNRAMAEQVQAALSSHVVRHDAEVSFRVEQAGRRSRLHVILDRSGFVLGRLRTADQAVAVLVRHLSAFCPTPVGTTRLSGVRALVNDDGGAVLAMWPILTEPALVERRMARTTFRMVDRLAVDVLHSGEIVMSPVAWASVAAGTEVTVGHAPPIVAPVRPSAFVALDSDGSETMTVARAVAFFASTMCGTSGAMAKLDLAERLGALPKFSTANDGAAVYDLLQRLPGLIASAEPESEVL